MRIILKTTARKYQSRANFLISYKKTLNASKTCKRIKKSLSWLYKQFRESPKFKRDYEEIRKEYDIMTESELVTKIKDGNLTAIMFYLKSKHPDYIAKQEISGKDGEPISFSWRKLDDKKELHDIKQSLEMTTKQSTEPNE